MNSCINIEKKRVIESNLPKIIENLKKHRILHKNNIAKREIDIRLPAWVRVNPGPSASPKKNCYRLCIGFQNVGCKYRDKDLFGLGCLNCGYYARTTFKEIPSDIIVSQFINGLIQGNKESTGFNAIEFLNDGSFLNNEEVEPEVAFRLFDYIKQMPHIERVLIESRPDYFDEEKIYNLCKHLRNDQIFEIGIGFESRDDFVRNTCINKGMTISDFETALNIVECVNNRATQEINVVVYILVKPAFLDNKEAIEDVILTIKYLLSIQNSYSFKIVPKIEPAAISDGTLLSMLYNDKDNIFSYEPLNYWAILEILARVALLKDDSIYDIRIGAREDMDDVIMAPAIYQDNGITFHPFDFVLYESIQKFNQHQNISILFSTIFEVYNQFNTSSITDKNSSMVKWLRKSKIDISGIEKYIQKKNFNFKDKAKNNGLTDSISFLTCMYKLLDIIEGYDKGHNVQRLEIIDSIKKKDFSKLERTLISCFYNISDETIITININSLSIYNKIAEIFFDATDLIRAKKYSIWSRLYI